MFCRVNNCSIAWQTDTSLPKAAGPKGVQEKVATREEAAKETRISPSLSTRLTRSRSAREENKDEASEVGVPHTATTPTVAAGSLPHVGNGKRLRAATYGKAKPPPTLPEMVHVIAERQ